MHDPRLDKLAEVIVRHCARVRTGDLVTIVAEADCLDGVEAVFRAVLVAGAHPSFHPRSERLQQLVLIHAGDEQLRHVCPFEEFRLARCDVLIVLRTSNNTRFLGGIDPSRTATMHAARRDLISMSMQRSAEGRMRYVLAELPSNGAAQDAEMSLAQYSDFVYGAGLLQLADPISAWKTLHEQQERARVFLQARQVLRIRADPVGDAGPTDLTVDVSGRTWVNCAAGQNFPDGEVFSGPRAVNGVLRLTHPTAYKGREVSGVSLTFRDGRVVDADARTNADYLTGMLDMDAGARFAGEIGIGTNYNLHHFVRNAFFDEKIGGTFHIALGAGYPETGNTNQSGLHWDFVSDLRHGGTIEADGEIIQRDGRFTKPGWPGN